MVDGPVPIAQNASSVIDAAVPPISGAEPLPFDELRTLEFVQGLSDEALQSLAPGVWRCTFAEGETVLRTGEYGDAAYYILDGFAEARLVGVTARDRAPEAPAGWLDRLKRVLVRSEAPSKGALVHRGFSPDGTIVLNDLSVELKPGYQARLQKGDIFGEVSALSRYPHSTDIVALTELRCVILPTPTLRRLKNEVDAFGETVDRLYVERTLDVHLARVDLFAGLPVEVLKALRDSAELCSYSPNQEIVGQGEPCDAFYLVRGGYVKVAVREEDRELSVTYLRKGDYAGEIGLLLEQPWPMTLTALEHVELVRIGRGEFRRALEASPRIEEELWNAVVARLKERGFAVRNPRAVESLARRDGQRADSRRERAADRSEYVHQVRRLRARLRRDARRRPAVHPRRRPRLALQRADRLLSVHRSCLHDRLSDRRDQPAAGHAPGRHRRGDVHRLSPLRQRLSRGTTSSRFPSTAATSRPGHRAGHEMRSVRRPRRGTGVRADVPARIGGACGLQGSGRRPDAVRVSHAVAARPEAPVLVRGVSGADGVGDVRLRCVGMVDAVAAGRAGGD